jgi:hypothetical protein
MITSAHSLPGRRYVAVSTPGGTARHYRLQFRQAGDLQWRLYGSFQREDEAHRNLDRLAQDGYQTRLVRFNICPATL